MLCQYMGCSSVDDLEDEDSLVEPCCCDFCIPFSMVSKVDVLETVDWE